MIKILLFVQICVAILTGVSSYLAANQEKPELAALAGLMSAFMLLQAVINLLQDIRLWKLERKS